jgi:cytochrome oxidase Cu insertion factor (SCO1/SenC/PrrC family)
MTRIALAVVVCLASAPAPRSGMVRVPAGSYRPLYAARSVAGGALAARVPVASFDIDVHAVTNAEYLAFVRAHPEWRRSRVSTLFAEDGYLRHWAGDLELGANAPPASPVVNVSWFAARAYLRSAGKELPTVDQWEYVAGRPPSPGGVTGLHGRIQEWTLDFNAFDVDRPLDCGGGAAGATAFDDYAAFMRYAYRSSLEARYIVANLGFRGVSAPAAAPRDAIEASPSIYDLPVPLVGADGRAHALADLRGRTVIAAMIYTSCTTVCPAIVEDMKAVERRLPARERANTGFALFSLDPGRDTPAALQRFASERQLDPARWRLFSTSEDDVRTLAAVFGVKYAKEPSGAIAHSATVVVIDPDGSVRRQ